VKILENGLFLSARKAPRWLLILPFVIFSSCHPAAVPPTSSPTTTISTPPIEWFNSAWPSRNAITITNPNHETLSDYQVQINLGNSNFDFTKALPKGTDLLVIDSDGLSKLNFWLESFDPISQSASVWVKVSSIRASSSKIIYLYYGNKSITTSASSGIGTFDIFTDPSTGIGAWTQTPSTPAQSVSIQHYLSTEAVALNTSSWAAGGQQQGLIADNTNLYVGVNNGSSVNGTIYKYSASGGDPLTSFPGPIHANCGDVRADTGNQIWSTGAVGVSAALWEIDRATGAEIAQWNLHGVDYGAGTCVAYIGPSQVYLFTSNASNAFKIRQLTLNGNGSYVLGPVWTSGANLGQVQGLAYANGALWLLTSAPNNLYVLSLNSDGSISATSTFAGLPAAETEGLSWNGTTLLYGSTDSIIRSFDSTQQSIHFVATAANQAPYLFYPSAVQPPVTMGAQASGAGTYPLMLGFADNTGTPPNQSNNGIVLGRLHGRNSYAYLYGRTILNGLSAEQAFPATTNFGTLQKYELKWHDGEAEFSQNSVPLGTPMLSVPTANLFPVIGGQTAGDTWFGADVKYIYLRKYASIEPSVSIGAIFNF
jgi:hypothetical protein